MLQGVMASSFTEARKRQLARLGGAKPPAPRAAIALAKSQAYQDAADAPATLRAYATDLANYKAWCDRHGFDADASNARGRRGLSGGCRRRLCDADTAPPRRRHRTGLWRRRPSPRHQASCDPRDAPRHRPEAWSTSPPSRPPSPRRRSRSCAGPAGPISPAHATAPCFWSALPALCGDPSWSPWMWSTSPGPDDGMKLLIERSKTDAEGEGAEITIPRGQSPRPALSPPCNTG